MYDKMPSNGHGEWVPSHIFTISEARNIKYSMLNDTEEYQCMHDRLPCKGVREYVTF